MSRNKVVVNPVVFNMLRGTRQKEIETGTCVYPGRFLRRKSLVLCCPSCRLLSSYVAWRSIAFSTKDPFTFGSVLTYHSNKMPCKYRDTPILWVLGWSVSHLTLPLPGDSGPATGLTLFTRRLTTLEASIFSSPLPTD